MALERGILGGLEVPFMIRRRSLVSLFSLFSLLFCGAACAQLPELTSDVCGNGFVEPSAGEACDTSDDAICYPPTDANACHLVCDADNAPCKENDPTKSEGWVCGLDHVCRLPAGTFAPSTTIPVDTTNVLLSDIDSDGRLDIVSVGQTGTDIFFVGNDGEVTGARRVALGGALPSAGLLQKPETNAPSGGSTLAFQGGVLGYELFDGKADRSIAPRVSPLLELPGIVTGARVIAADLDQDWGSDLLLIATISAGPQSGLYLGAPTGKAPIYKLPLTVTDDETVVVGGAWKTLARSQPVAMLSLMAKCPQIVLAYLGDPRVYVAPLCNAMGDVFSGRDLETDALALQLPPGVFVEGDPYVRDVDLDNIPDLMVTVTCGPLAPPDACARVIYAKGFGDGTFQAQWQPYFVTDQQTPAPLAMVDLNGDGGVDVVTSFAIYLTAPIPGGVTPPFGVVAAPLTRYWTRAATIDLNGDGLLDVAAIEDGRPGVDVFLNADNFLFNSLSVPTETPVRNLVGGDFNGDFHDDLAYLAETSNPSLTQNLMLVRGRASGGLETPAEIAKLHGVTQTTSADVTIPSRQDAAKDLIFVSRDETTSALTLTTAIGDVVSGLLTPLILVHTKPPEPPKIGYPLSSSIGAFGLNGEPSLAALVAVEKKGLMAPNVELWNITTNAAGALVASDAKRVVIEGLVPYPDAAFMLTTNLDGPQGSTIGNPEELVIAWYKFVNADTTMPVVLVARPNANGELEVTKEIKALEGEGLFLSPLVSGDLNGDGFADIITTTCSLTESTCNVAVLWNEDGGAMGRTLSAPVPVPGATGYPLNVVVLPSTGETKGENRDELLVILPAPEAMESTASSFAYRVTFEQEAGFSALEKVIELSPAAHIVAGDLDGDRITDLVTSAPGLISIYRGKDRVP